MILRSPSRGRRRIATGAAALLCIMTARSLSGACGPYFPNWILGRDEVFLNSPGGVLRFEIERLELPPDPSTPSAPKIPTSRPRTPMRPICRRRWGRRMPPEKRAKIVSRHAELRKLIHDFALNTATQAILTAEWKRLRPHRSAPRRHRCARRPAG